MALRVGSVTPRGVASVTLNPANVVANTTAEQTFTVNGLATDMLVVVNKPTADAGLVLLDARVSAANTLALTFQNTTGSDIDAAAQEFRVVAL